MRGIKANIPLNPRDRASPSVEDHADSKRL